MRCRAAFTLTELLITMSAGSVLMMLAVGLLHQTMHLTSGARGRAAEQQTFFRLADQFRQDVYRANEVIEQSPDMLRLSVPGLGEVSYTAEHGGCIRTAPAQQVDSVGFPEVHREWFGLQTGATIRFEQSDEPSRASLTAYPAASSAARPQAHAAESETFTPAYRPLIQIEAVVGRLLQLHQPALQEAP